MRDSQERSRGRMTIRCRKHHDSMNVGPGYRKIGASLKVQICSAVCSRDNQTPESNRRNAFSFGIGGVRPCGLDSCVISCFARGWWIQIIHPNPSTGSFTGWIPPALLPPQTGKQLLGSPDPPQDEGALIRPHIGRLTCPRSSFFTQARAFQNLADPGTSTRFVWTPRINAFRPVNIHK